jgi:hypothetical protein
VQCVGVLPALVGDLLRIEEDLEKNIAEVMKSIWCAGESEGTKAASGDARPNLHSKLRASQSFSRRITRTCAPLTVARIGHN